MVVMFFKACSIIIAFPSTTILLTNSCTSLRILGTLNGFATAFSGIGRALGPASTGLAFSWGVDNGYIVTAYYFLALIAAIGAIPVFMIVDGDGPSASVDNSDEEGGHPMEDSAVIIPESAIDEDSQDETSDYEESADAPLLGGAKNRRADY